MITRDEFALSAMKVILTGQIKLERTTFTQMKQSDYEKIAQRAYRMADEMIKVGTE